MCDLHLSRPQQMPLNTPGGPAAALMADEIAGQNARTVPVSTETRFSKLLKFLAPLAEGAMVGWAGGQSHPHGGFGAATEHFQHKYDRELQKLMFGRQLRDSEYKNQLEAARTQHELNRPNFNTGQPVRAMVGGRPVLLQQNPETGVFEPMPDATPYEQPQSDLYSPVSTDQGIVSFDRRSGTAAPVTLGGAPQQAIGPDLGMESNAPDTSGLWAGAVPNQPRPATRFNSGTPRVPRLPSAGMTVLHAPERRFKQSQADMAAEELRGAGFSEEEIYRRLHAGARRPEATGMTQAKYAKRKMQLEDRLRREFARSEKERKSALRDLEMGDTNQADFEAGRQ